MEYSKKTLIVINLITLFFTVFIETYETLLPFILINVFNASMFIVGIVESVSEALSNLLKFYGGYASDNKSRKSLIIFGLGFLSLSNVAVFMVSKWQEVLFLSFLKSISEGLLIPAKDLILSDATKNLGRIFALNKIFENFGELLGILTALLISSYLAGLLDIKSIFLNFGIICIFFILVLSLINFDKDAEDKERKEPLWKAIHHRLLMYFFVLSFANLGYSFYVLKIYEYSKSQSTSLSIYLIFSIFLIVFAYIAGRIYDRINLKTFLTAVSVLFFVSNLLIILNPIVGFLLLAIAEAFLEVGIWATVGKIAKQRKGFVFGLYYFIVGIAGSISALIAGYIWDSFSSNYPFLISAFISLLSLGFIGKIRD